MGMLKQIHTGTSAATLIPSSEPTTDDYVNWKAKHYGSKLGSANARANALDQYDFGAMKKYEKILRKAGKFPVS